MLQNKRIAALDVYGKEADTMLMNFLRNLVNFLFPQLAFARVKADR